MRKYNPATLPTATVLFLILRSSWEVNGFGILGIFMMDKTAKLSSLPILSIILSIIPAPASQESSQTSKNDFCGYRIVFKGKNNKTPNGCDPLGVVSWRLCRDSNPDLTLRRGLFYPVELQRRTVLKLSVFTSECLSGPQL